VTGKELFAAMMAHFGGKVKIIESNWSRASGLTTNIDLLNRATGAGLSVEDAAPLTWTGLRASDYGYDKVIVVHALPQGAQGNYTTFASNFRGENMNPRADVISELRSLFKDGATPSRLIRHIVERHEGERNIHLLVQAYFLEAFDVPIVRGLNPTDDFLEPDLRYAFLNEQIVHEMIQKRSEWDTTTGTNGTSDWLDSVKATDDQERIRQTQSEPIPELSRCWDQLTPKEQIFIHRSLASANGLYESVKILSRLAESLQQQLAEREAMACADNPR
jgi:hypothetical protein